MKLSTMRTDSQSLYQRTNEIFNPRLEDTPVNKSRYIKNKLSHALHSSVITNHSYKLTLNKDKKDKGPSEFQLNEEEKGEEKGGELERLRRVNQEQRQKIASLVAFSEQQESSVSKYLGIIGEQNESLSALKIANQKKQQALREKDTEVQVLRERIKHYLENNQVKQQQDNQQDLQSKLEELQQKTSQLQSQNRKLESIIQKLESEERVPSQEGLPVQRDPTQHTMIIGQPPDLSGSLQDYKIVQDKEDQLLSTSFMAMQKISSQLEFIKSSQNKQIPMQQFDSGNMIYSDNSNEYQNKYETPPQDHKLFSSSSRPRTQRSNTRYQSNEASFEQ